MAKGIPPEGRSAAQEAALQRTGFKPKLKDTGLVQISDRLSVGENILDEWHNHEENWEHCKKCSLGHTAINHVLCRGRLPCDLLIVGEAPGKTEDAVGYPFIGPSGKLLDTAITAVTTKLFPENDRTLSYAITNIVACIPWEDDCTIRQPSELEARSCSSRLSEIITLAKPKGIILLGQVSQRYSKLLWPEGSECAYPVRELYHPAYILRRGGVSSPEYKDMVSSITQFCTKIGLQTKR